MVLRMTGAEEVLLRADDPGGRCATSPWPRRREAVVLHHVERDERAGAAEA